MSKGTLCALMFHLELASFFLFHPLIPKNLFLGMISGRASRDLDNKNSFESKSRFGGLSLEVVVSSEGLERKTFVIHD